MSPFRHTVQELTLKGWCKLSCNFNFITSVLRVSYIYMCLFYRTLQVSEFRILVSKHTEQASTTTMIWRCLRSKTNFPRTQNASREWRVRVLRGMSWEPNEVKCRLTLLLSSKPSTGTQSATHTLTTIPWEARRNITQNSVCGDYHGMHFQCVHTCMYYWLCNCV